MKTLLSLALFSFASPAFAADFLCEGRDGVRGHIELKLFDDGRAYLTGSYSWDAQSGEDTRTHSLNCDGKLSNAGRSGNASHDYFELNRRCSVDYVRTPKGFARRDHGYVQLVTRGASDHDMSGYVMASFLCR